MPALDGNHVHGRSEGRRLLLWRLLLWRLLLWRLLLWWVVRVLRRRVDPAAEENGEADHDRSQLHAQRP